MTRFEYLFRTRLWEQGVLSHECTPPGFHISTWHGDEPDILRFHDKSCFVECIHSNGAIRSGSRVSGIRNTSPCTTFHILPPTTDSSGEAPAHSTSLMRSSFSITHFAEGSFPGEQRAMLHSSSGLIALGRSPAVSCTGGH